MRDYYRTHPDEAKAYADLKEYLNAQYPDDYSAYRAGKHEFLDALEERAKEWKNNCNT